MTADVQSRAHPITGAPHIPNVLHSARMLMRPAIQEAVARLDPTNRRAVAYHLGWTELDGTPGAGGGGKCVRPALALLSARAVGGSVERAVPGAVGVELLHNFSLLHDDVMDGDTHRRHRRTVWAVWGVPTAVLAGDALLALAVEVVLDRPSKHGVAAARLLTETTRRLVHGQTQDLAFERCSSVGLDECRRMVEGKTGALLAASAAIGAVLAGAEETVVAALAAFGNQLGVAFQLVDDVLGIWGSPARTGKPCGSDLRAGKKTLPVCWALAQNGAAGRELGRRLECPGQPDEAAVAEMAELLEVAGAREWAAEEALTRLTAAHRALDEVPIERSAHVALAELARYVVAREA